MNMTKLNNETRELNIDELDRVVGGLDESTERAIDNAIINLPVVGTIAQTLDNIVRGGKAVANLLTGTKPAN
jgi:hypothetical protein